MFLPVLPLAWVVLPIVNLQGHVCAVRGGLIANVCGSPFGGTSKLDLVPAAKDQADLCRGRVVQILHIGELRQGLRPGQRDRDVVWSCPSLGAGKLMMSGQKPSACV